MKVLIIDDSDAIGRGLVELLRLSGIEGVFCTSYDETNRAVAESAFDLAIVDGQLGDHDYSEAGLAGQIILQLLRPKKIRFIRLSMAPQNIPGGLRGLKVVAKSADPIAEVEQLLAKRTAKPRGSGRKPKPAKVAH